MAAPFAANFYCCLPSMATSVLVQFFCGELVMTIYFLKYVYFCVERRMTPPTCLLIFCRSVYLQKLRQCQHFIILVGLFLVYSYIGRSFSVLLAYPVIYFFYSVIELNVMNNTVEVVFFRFLSYLVTKINHTLNHCVVMFSARKLRYTYSLLADALFRPIRMSWGYKPITNKLPSSMIMKIDWLNYISIVHCVDHNAS